MINKDPLAAQLLDFQKKLDIDRAHLTALSQSLERFVSVNNPIEAIHSIRDLLNTQRKLGPFLAFEPLFAFDDGFWLAQLFVRLLSFRQNHFFSAFDARGQLAAGLRSAVLPNFEFVFVPAALAAGGFYLQEANLQIRILYFDLFHHRLFIDPTGLLKLFCSPIGSQLSDRQVLLTVEALNDLADALLADQFVLDLNLIQMENDAQLEIAKVDLPVLVSDKLFILAQANQVDIVALDNGFLLNFSSSLKVYFTQVVDRIGHAQWRFCVSDDQNVWSFLAVLLKYSWFRNWYFDDLPDLQITYRDEFFLG